MILDCENRIESELASSDELASLIAMLVQSYNQVTGWKVIATSVAKNKVESELTSADVSGEAGDGHNSQPESQWHLQQEV